MGNEEHLTEPDSFQSDASLPGPIEASQPRATHLKTLHQHRASIEAWQAGVYAGDPSCLSYGTACLIIETYLASLEAQRSKHPLAAHLEAMRERQERGK